jgi:glycosyltransferase involved in cell wall biosynthesis
MAPEVSVIMNCFNGEKYLREALDSIFAQTFEDWEIVFIDNCSTDSSVAIASDYGSRIKIFKTKENITLGAARNFGMSQCNGEYIAFLDTDDVWLPNAIKKLLDAIKSGNYALAYAGHMYINEINEVIGQMQPKKKKGQIFGDLLKQFDIPIVTSLVSKKYLLDSGLAFDDVFFASEEYGLFMQLAVTYNFIVVDSYVTKYRIHDFALTIKTISKWADERRYTLNKIIKENTGIEENYQAEFNEAFARASYYEAQYFMSIGDSVSASNALSHFKYSGFFYFFMYILSRYFSKYWRLIQKIIYPRKAFLH